MINNNNYQQETPQAFPQRLKQLLDETRVSQQEVADYVGVSRQSVSQWAMGRVSPDAYSFKKIAQFFKVPLEYLYGDTESRIKENFLLSDSLGLSDKTIEILHALNNTAVSTTISQTPRVLMSQVFSAIVETEEFLEMMACIHGAIKYSAVEKGINKSFSKIWTDENEYNSTIDSLLQEKTFEKEETEVLDEMTETERKIFKLMASNGNVILSPEEMEVFCVYRAVNTFNKIAEKIPKEILKSYKNLSPTKEE